jgi:hypothetical protein
VCRASFDNGTPAVADRATGLLNEERFCEGSCVWEHAKLVGIDDTVRQQRVQICWLSLLKRQIEQKFRAPLRPSRSRQ